MKRHYELSQGECRGGKFIPKTVIEPVAHLDFSVSRVQLRYRHQLFSVRTNYPKLRSFNYLVLRLITTLFPLFC